MRCQGGIRTSRVGNDPRYRRRSVPPAAWPAVASVRPRLTYIATGLPPAERGAGRAADSPIPAARVHFQAEDVFRFLADWDTAFMILGGVQIPTEVLTAWEEGNLVLFTGAGISIPSPSGLPGFEDLALQVAQTVGSSLDPRSAEWSGQLDTFMDVLNEGEGVDVHRLVQGIVTRQGSKPNANHEALASIATQYPTRVVTTNYDLHLETALREHDRDLEVFRAPAMPLGQDFDGLVYLHGSAQDDPRRFVVTDRDFSAAYFHNAWATRFLERMFREYVVLFVGYSHADVVMKYLGLGLGPESRRYALTDDPDNITWRRLQITALEYPHKRHDLLTECLVEWSKLGRMGLLDHRQRIRELVAIPSAVSPDEESYLEASLVRPDRIRFFCQYATDKYWMEWAAKSESFKKLFDRSAEPDPVARELAEWFASRFALADDADTENPDDRPSAKAWTVFAEAGGVLSPPAWNSIASCLHAWDYPKDDEKKPRPAHVLRWLWVLMEQEQVGCQGDFLEYAVTWPEVSRDPELFLALLGYLMTPYLVPERGWGAAHIGVKTRSDLYWLDEAWKKVAPNLSTWAATLLPVAEVALLRHLNLEASLGHPRGFTWRRSAIQPHEQDRHRDPIDAVIDAVRDTAVAMWDTDEAFVSRIVERWLASGHDLMRRIAVHVTGARPGATPDEHVRFVLDHDLHAARGVSQEVLHLLGQAAPGAASDLVDQLVDAWKPETDDERDLYRAFSRLEPLERLEVENQNLRSTLEEVRSKLPPGLQGSPYPGMSSWMETGSGDGARPSTVEAFDKQVQENPEAAVQFVLSFEEQSFPRSGETSREDAILLLRDTVQHRATAGLDLWPHLDDYPELKDTVVAAWGHTKATDDAEAIMNILASIDLAPVLEHGVSQFFMYAARSGAPWEQYPATDQFIEHVWAACATDKVFKHGESRDWIGESINVPAGQAVDFWFEMFHRRWTAAGDEWRRLPEADRAFLERALADHTERGALALTHMAGRMHLLDAADSEWTRTHLLPLGDWATETVAEPFWWGFLSFSRWNRGLVAAGLLAGLIDTGKHLDRFDDDQARRWASLLAYIAIQATDPSPSVWVREMTVKTGAAHRVRWLQALEDALRDLDAQGRRDVWTEWLAEYWRRRTLADPVSLSPAEANTLATLATHIPNETFADAVTLVEATTAGFDSHAEAARHVPDQLIVTYPADVARFFIHLMSHTDESRERFWGSHHLEPKLKLLVAQSGDWTLLRDAALRLRIDLPK